MSDRKFGPITRELIAAKKRIENPENWASEEESCGTGIADHKRCALLALGFYGERSKEAEMYLLEASFQGGGKGIIYTNSLGHAAVMQMYDHAIARAIKEGR